MRPRHLIVLPALVALALGCKGRHHQAPTWVQASPVRCEAGVSGKAGWLLEQPQFQELLAKYPLAGQSLDLFLKKARLNPHTETGRLSLFAMGLNLESSNRKGSIDAPNFLLQFQGFKDPAALQKTVTESFPVEGSLRVQGAELPLHVVLDVNQYHVRILTDLDGNLWLGDLSALTVLSTQGRPQGRDAVLQASAWINRDAALQGFLRPQALMKNLSGHVSADLARELPQGLECVAWGIQPLPGPDALYTFEISIAGSPESITQSTPWLQRIVALATSLRSGNAAPPDLLQERQRAVLRCQLSWEQVGAVLSKFSQPNLAPPPGASRP